MALAQPCQTSRAALPCWRWLAGIMHCSGPCDGEGLYLWASMALQRAV